MFFAYYKKTHPRKQDPELIRAGCKEFVDFIRKQTGFFCEKGINTDGDAIYGFMHLTFEEYLSAIEFTNRWANKEIELSKYIFNSRWREIIKLAASHLSLTKGAGKAMTTNFVNDLLHASDDYPEFFRGMRLVLEMFFDDIKISSELTNSIFEKCLPFLSEKGKLHQQLRKLYNSIFESSFGEDAVDFLLSALKNEFLPSIIDTLICSDSPFVKERSAQFRSIIISKKHALLYLNEYQTDFGICSDIFERRMLHSKESNENKNYFLSKLFEFLCKEELNYEETKIVFKPMLTVFF